MMPLNVLINCANLHHGGGVTVAASFLASLTTLMDTKNVSVLLSQRVHANVLALGIHGSQFKQYKVIDYVGISAIWKRLDKEFIGYDVIFTVFGPVYTLLTSSIHVMGFAQAPIAYPHNLFDDSLSFFAWFKRAIKHRIQAYFFKRSDHLIVELEHVKKALCQQKGFCHLPIHIVHNTLDDVYDDRARWQAVTLPVKEKVDIRLGLVSKNYPHKNIACLPALKTILAQKYGIKIACYVTFSEKEWASCSDLFQQEVINVGPLLLSQCPLFYSQLDGVIFPSLLECFSAVPLEAMRMKKPLFASQLPFVVDCCLDYAYYFDPLDVENMADSIMRFFTQSQKEKEAFTERAYNFSLRYNTAKNRAHQYWTILNNALHHTKK